MLRWPLSPQKTRADYVASTRSFTAASSAQSKQLEKQGANWQPTIGYYYFPRNRRAGYCENII